MADLALRGEGPYVSLCLVLPLGLMGTIPDFRATFARDFEKYSAVEKAVEALCKERLRDIVFLWTSRVKDPASLEKKLKDRLHEYENEAANVADIKDLVGARIVLAHWNTISYVEKVIRQTFTFIARTQHPKQMQNLIDSETRFRGYDALHLYVSLQGGSSEPSWNPVIEIQVMTGFMWEFQSLHHDVEYKQLHGIPSKEQLSALDLLKGVANLGEVALERYDERFFRPSLYPDLQSRAKSVLDEEEAPGTDKEQHRRVGRRTNSQHEHPKLEASDDQLWEEYGAEERAYALLRKTSRDKEAHLRDVAKARRTLHRAMTLPLRDDLSRTRHLRNLYYLAIAERKLSLTVGLDTSLRMRHLDQAEVYINEAFDLGLLSLLAGAREQMTVERHIVKGLKATLDLRTKVRYGERTRMLLRDATDGIRRALGELRNVDEVKYGKNAKFALVWMNYFSKASA